jgi:type IV pilus assembly protein PilO
VKTGKPVSQSILIAAIVGGVFVLGIAVWFLLVHPQGGKLTDLKKQAADVQEKIDVYHQQVVAARSTPKIEVADVYRLAKAMPSKPDMPDLVLELSQLARDTGLRFDSISPQPVAPIGSYSVLPITVTFQGNFYSLADFLYRLRALVHGRRTNQGIQLDATGRLFSVDTLAFNESELKFPQIQATLVIDAIVYASAPVPVPAAAPPASATTTTTPTTTSTTATTTTTGATPSSSTSATGAP